MRRIIIIAALTLLLASSQAQLVLEKDFPLEDIRYFYITDNEGVYANYSVYSVSDTILLFNDDMQLVQTVITPADSILSIISISKFMYNADDLFELIYTFQTFENGSWHYHTHIINENSSLLESLEDQYIWIHNTASGPRLISQKGSKVYTMPGIIYPVLKGDPASMGLSGETGIPELPVLESIVLSEPYPNPASISCMIDFQLTTSGSHSSLVFYDLSGIRRLSISLASVNGSMEIHKSLLGSGTFFYRIESGEGTSEIRKLIFE